MSKYNKKFNNDETSVVGVAKRLEEALHSKSFFETEERKRRFALVPTVACARLTLPTMVRYSHYPPYLDT